MDPEDYMLFEKLLMGENGHRRHKSAAQSARITSFHPLAVTSGLGHQLKAFSS
jgi:hypothetical protein